MARVSNMADSFRWRLTETRDQLIFEFVDAIGENTKVKALEDAGWAYLRLVGRIMVEPGSGLLHELLEAAEERGRLDAAEIAAILATEELPLEYEPAEWSVGGGN